MRIVHFFAIMSNMTRRKKITLVLISIEFLLASFIFGFYFRDTKIVNNILAPKDSDFYLIFEAYQLLKNQFVNSDEIDNEKLIHGAINGMVESLDDPYTSFFNQEETERFIEETEGKFEGIGVEVGVRDKDLQVIAPLKGAPADKAGLMPGDLILEIDGVDVKGLAAEEIIDMIKGPKGTDVTILIKREGWSEPRKFVITRDVIEVSSIEWDILEDNIAHVMIHHFRKNIDTEFRKIALDILASDIKGIIIDVRRNPGGFLEVTKQLGEWFMEKDEIFVIEDFPREKKEDRVSKTGRLSQYPVVVLIDKGSASASEILAGALRDNRGALLIGENSFGKGSIQTLRRLSDNSSIKITIASWLTPKGEMISGKGLAPDIEVEMTQEDYDRGRDPQLNKAVETIKEMI